MAAIVRCEPGGDAAVLPAHEWHRPGSDPFEDIRRARRSLLETRKARATHLELGPREAELLRRHRLCGQIVIRAQGGERPLPPRICGLTVIVGGE